MSIENDTSQEELNLNDEETTVKAEVSEDEEFEEIDLTKELQTLNRKLKDENQKLENELNACKDKLLRLTSEYENYRKRTAKEKEGIYTDACEDVLKNILPVLDNLERAADVNGSVEDIKKGIDMTIRQFNDSLSKLQVEVISTSEGFDPNLHNAVMHVEDDGLDKNQVVEVFQKGYRRGDKVLRHSMVKVAN